MIIFKNFRSTVEDMVAAGTDIPCEGNFQHTLAFNHFTQQDMQFLQHISAKLRAMRTDCIQILSLSLDKLPIEGKSKPTSADIEAYVDTFFHSERDNTYPGKIVPFFRRLRDCGCAISQLLVIFNQMHFYIITQLLSKSGGSKSHASIKSLHKAGNMEQQIMTEVFNESVMEQLSRGISLLMDKNAEIIFIKDLLDKVNKQTLNSQNVMAATEQMTASIQEVAKNSSQVADKAQETTQKTNLGKDIVLSALNGMIGSGRFFSEMVAHFKLLENKITNIQNITQMIKEIADQTHLLSLNASIEAARAGEHGAGFAVISGEIRKLADHTSASLLKVEENVAEFRKLSDELSESVVSTSDTIQENLLKAKTAMPIMDDIVQQIEVVNDSTNSIAAISQEQAAAIDEVAHRMMDITNLSEQVNELTNHTGQAIYNLSKMMDTFRSSMFAGNVKLNAKTLLWLAKTDHILWKWRVYNMLLGFESIDPNSISSHKDCRLGKWYFDAEVQSQFKSLDVFVHMDEPHQDVHHYARLAAEAVDQGNSTEAERHLVMLEAASHKVVERINLLLEQL